jgi:hypothetical protein
MHLEKKTKKTQIKSFLGNNINILPLDEGVRVD